MSCCSLFAVLLRLGDLGMTRVGLVQAIRPLRRLRGGSQPLLVEASDGHLYVIKMLGNPQGPNILFNEALGTEIFRSAGLLVPEWRAVVLSDDFIDGHREIWFETENGPCRQSAGCCFGSRLLGSGVHSLLEILPRGSFARIRNRRDLWMAWVLDVLCEHTDNRQAIFIEDETRYLDAYFIDHGNLFGGAHGTMTPIIQGCRYLDPRVYDDVKRGCARQIFEAIRCIDTNTLLAVAADLPASWTTETAMGRLRRFCERIGHPALLRDTIRLILGAGKPVQSISGKDAETGWGVRPTLAVNARPR